MPRKRKNRRRDDSSSSDAISSNDEVSTGEASPAARETQRNTKKKEDKGIKQILKEMKEETSEMRKQLKALKDESTEIHRQLKKLTESHNNLQKQLFHINGSSGDDSAAPRSELNQVQLPRYRLEFTSGVNDELEKGQLIETKNHEKMISVALYDDHNKVVVTEPLASAKVRLVVVNGEFNQHGNQYIWLRKDFERNIKRPRQRNSATGDVNQSIESIVSNCVFKLDGGVKSHTGARILENSGNKKVRLGVMVLSPMEERVLEGLSNPFFVRGHDRPTRQKQAQVGYDRQERNALMLNIQNPSWPILNQPGEISFDPIAALNTALLSTEPSTSASILQDQYFHQIMQGVSIAQDTNNLCGTQFNMDHIARLVQLVCDMPNVEQRKSWNLFDQLMPLYSCQPRFYNCSLATMPLMTQHLGFLTFIPKDVMQTTHRKKGVLIEPLEPDDSDEERLLMKSKLHSKYRLRFVNKVRKVYYQWEKIKASDGDFLKVALFDENNTPITSGPLSSALVMVAALHGDFNVGGENYWTPQEFSRCEVDAVARLEERALGGDRVLALADGEACLYDSYFQITSLYARTGKFKLGVKLAIAEDERIQEGISEPFG